MNALPLRIDDKHCLTVSAMRAHSRPRKRSEGLGLIVVDYIQLVHTVGKHQNRDQEVGAVSRALKDLAKDLEVPVLALSQLNRGAEGREDRKPQLSDLRESGSLEQDADEVIGLYREHYYLERQRLTQRPDEDVYDFEARRQKHEDRCDAIRFQAEALILKNRFGPTGNYMIGADLACMRFMDVEEI